MTYVVFVVVAALAGPALYLGISYLVRAHNHYRGSRRIICPDNSQEAVVEVDAGEALSTSAFGFPKIRLQDCSRWPDHEGCGQGCLLQLDVSPFESLVRAVLMRWYELKSCVYCGDTFDQIRLLEHKPALRNPNGKLQNWNEVAIADVKTGLKNYRPVCWDCYVAQPFVSDPPQLVTYRPWQAALHRSPDNWP